jgi:hypothetical protein
MKLVLDVAVWREPGNLCAKRVASLSQTRTLWTTDVRHSESESRLGVVKAQGGISPDLQTTIIGFKQDPALLSTPALWSTPGVVDDQSFDDPCQLFLCRLVQKKLVFLRHLDPPVSGAE